MAVFDSRKCGPLLQELEAAHQAEGKAITEWKRAQESGASASTQRPLIDHFLDLHEKKMGIWKQLQSQRLDTDNQPPG